MLLKSAIILLCCHYVTASLLPLQPINYRSFKKLFNFIEINFREEYNILAVTGIINEKTHDLLDWTLLNYQTTPSIVTNTQYVHATTNYPIPANVILVILDHIDNINGTVDQVLKSPFFTYQSYIFFIIVHGEVSSSHWIFTAGAYLWDHHLLRFFFVYLDKKLQILSYNPFRKNKKDNFTKVAAYEDMFYNKVDGLNGYAIRGGTVEDIPRAVYQKGKLYVSDKELLFSILRHINATVIEDYLPGASYNKLVDGLNNHTLDCTFIMHFIYSFHDVDNKKDLKFSYPYNQDATVIILPKPKYKPTYLNIFYIFQSTLWICLIATCLLITLAIAVLDRIALANTESPTFQTLRLMINLPVLRLQNAVPSKKVLLAFCIWLAFFFHMVFQSSLTSTLIRPKRYDRITTLEGLLKSNLKIYMFSKQRAQRASSWECLKDRYIYVNKTEIFNMIMAGNDRFGYVCNSKQSAQILVRRSRNKLHKGLFYVLKDDLIPSYRTFLFPKNSPYLSTIDDYLLLYREFGLMNHKYGSMEVQKVLIPEKDLYAANRAIKRKVLSLSHMQTCFYIWLLGLIVSSIVFVLEILWHKYQTKRNLHR